MKSLLRFAAWATLTFVVAWSVAGPYQRAIAGIAGRLVVGPGREVEWGDVEIFFPYDLGVYVALCLASAWVGWRARARAVGLGLIVLVVVEIATLFVVMKVLLATAGAPPERSGGIQRLLVGLIRLTGLAAGAATWLVLLGWQRLPPFGYALERRLKRNPGGGREP